MKLIQNSGIPIYQQIADQFKTDILSEKYSIKFVNASNTDENLQSSESKITDADMAKSILEYSKNSILEQAVQAMLSQTKSGVETVKNLLTT